MLYIFNSKMGRFFPMIQIQNENENKHLWCYSAWTTNVTKFMWQCPSNHFRSLLQPFICRVIFQVKKFAPKQCQHLRIYLACPEFRSTAKSTTKYFRPILPTLKSFGVEIRFMTFPFYYFNSSIQRKPSFF